VTGEDAADFLQSQFTNDLRPFSAGQCSYGLWLDFKGKIVADSWVCCEGEECFRLYSEGSPGDLIQEKLESHIIADDVEIERAQPVAAVAVFGSLPKGSENPTGSCSVFPGRRCHGPSHEIIFPDAASRDLWLERAGLEAVCAEWVLIERIKAGLAQVHSEVLPGDLPEEGGLMEDAVSLTKGCFLGQEVVARMHNVGRPHRGLYVLAGSGALPGRTSAVSNQDGKVLGELRSIAALESGWKGVAMLKSRFAEPGARVILDDAEARIEGSYGRAG
jgi:folate-binding protein YgfZ